MGYPSQNSGHLCYINYFVFSIYFVWILSLGLLSHKMDLVLVCNFIRQRRKTLNWLLKLIIQIPMLGIGCQDCIWSIMSQEHVKLCKWTLHFISWAHYWKFGVTAVVLEFCVLNIMAAIFEVSNMSAYERNSAWCFPSVWKRMCVLIILIPSLSRFCLKFHQDLWS